MSRWIARNAVACGLIWALAGSALAQTSGDPPTSDTPTTLPAPKAAKPASKPGAKKPTAKPTKVTAEGEVYRETAKGIMDALADTGDAAAAMNAMGRLWAHMLAYAPLNDGAAFAEVDVALRQVQQMTDLPAAQRKDELAYLRSHPKVATALALLVYPGADKASEVYAVLDKLRADPKRDLEAYANLAAAICVVHDKPLERHINENTVDAPDAGIVFDYFVAADKAGGLANPIADMPGELLVNVVDVTGQIGELTWAFDRYRNNYDIHQRYFDVTYDKSAYFRGTKKKIDEVGFTLPNILKYGGICADQAYFASSVAKAQGIPSAYVRGKDGTVGHAWVGYMKSRGSSVEWDFSSGRYDSYQAVRGSVTDPQTGMEVSDADLAVQADSILVDAQQRREATALTDAAISMAGFEKQGLAWPPTDDGLPIAAKAKPRALNVASALTLLDASVQKLPGQPRAWRFVASLADQGRLSYDEKVKWADTLMSLCGAKYPDFTIGILLPMVATVKDTQQQDRLWENMAGCYRSRADLVSEVRVMEAKMWEQAGDPSQAWDCYQVVIGQYLNSGPAALSALRWCEQLLREKGKNEAVLPMYANAWTHMTRPRGLSMSPEVLQQSNYFWVGSHYAKLLEAAGMNGDAAKIKRQIGDSMQAE